MAEDTSIQAYKHKLTALTSGSVALINELTHLAEVNLQDSQEIVSIIEERISKCLPRYKLFAIYLMDSIVKKIGNPYNILFERNLFKIFVDSYRLVDTATRQQLIDLFKTWITGTTNSGLKIFNTEVIQKIEEFVIRATNLDQNQLRSGTDPVKLNERERQFKLPTNINSEHFIRECNILLQYIITINYQLEAYENTKFFKKNMMIRNDIISKINDIFDSLYRDHKNFHHKINYYHKSLVEIRSILDEQNLKQNLFLQSKYKPNLKPNLDYVKLLDKPFEAIEDNEVLVIWIKNFGIPIKNEELYKLVSPPPLEVVEKSYTQPSDNPLGLEFLDDSIDAALNELSNNDVGSEESSNPLKRTLDQPKPTKKVRFDV